jgi:dihydropteroate synthase
MLYHKIYDLSDDVNFDIKAEISHIGTGEEVVDYLKHKATFKRFYVRELDHRAANILKQEALSVGCDTAISYKTYTLQPEKSDVLIFGTEVQLKKLSEKLLKQPFKLKNLGMDLSFILNSGVFEPMKIGELSLIPEKMPYIMSVLNVTPDSFYSGSRVNEAELEEKVKAMIEAKVDIIDIGGESTRPYASVVSEEEELKRVLPAIEAIRKISSIPISIDTNKANVAKKAIEAGADCINDISALRMDPHMVEVAIEYKKPVILMHMKGEPKNMQQNPSYENVVDEVYDFFKERMEFCVENGINEKNIILDVGIGFGKRYKDNLALSRNFKYFTSFKKPVVYAASRKTFVGVALKNAKDPLPPEKRLYGSLAAHFMLANNAAILRVHDFEQIMDMIKVKKEIDGVDRFEHPFAD